jgi:hypothetical protein
VARVDVWQAGSKKTSFSKMFSYKARVRPNTRECSVVDWQLSWDYHRKDNGRLEKDAMLLATTVERGEGNATEEGEVQEDTNDTELNFRAENVSCRLCDAQSPRKKQGRQEQEENQAATASAAAAIRFDGVYQGESEPEGGGRVTVWDYLRFYPDGTVVQTRTTENNPNKIGKELTKGNRNSEGQYKTSGSALEISVTSPNPEWRSTANYRGTLQGTTLTLERTFSSLVKTMQGDQVLGERWESQPSSGPLHYVFIPLQ